MSLYDSRLALIRLVAALYVVLILGVILCATNRWFVGAFQFVQQTAGDKLMHFLLVGMLAFLINLSFRSATWFQIQRGTIVLTVGTTLEEISQIGFRYRSFDLGDLAFNLLGIAVFGMLSWWTSAWLGIRRPHPRWEFADPTHPVP